MSNSKENVSVGKPKIGGAIFRAASGTTLPNAADDTLAAAFACLGYVSDDGVTNSNSIETENIKAWGGDTVLTTQNDKTDTFTFKLIEVMNEEVLKTVFGNSNVSGNLASGIAISVNSKELEESVFVIDMILTGSTKKRIVIPAGKVSSIADIKYADDEAIGYEITITCNMDNAGQTHYEYMKAKSTT